MGRPTGGRRGRERGVGKLNLLIANDRLPNSLAFDSSPTRLLLIELFNLLCVWPSDYVPLVSLVFRLLWRGTSMRAVDSLDAGERGNEYARTHC